MPTYANCVEAADGKEEKDWRNWHLLARWFASAVLTKLTLRYADLFNSVCIATIMRTVYVHQIDTADPTCMCPTLFVAAPANKSFQGAAETGIWATVEVAMAIVCGCLPVLAPLMRTQMQSLRSKSWGSTSWGKTWSGRSKISKPVLINSGSGSMEHQDELKKNEKKPTARNTAYPQEGSQTDEEMSLP